MKRKEDVHEMLKRSQKVSISPQRAFLSEIDI